MGYLPWLEATWKNSELIAYGFTWGHGCQQDGTPLLGKPGYNKSSMRYFMEGKAWGHGLYWNKGLCER
jgi:hypothetical protein